MAGSAHHRGIVGKGHTYQPEEAVARAREFVDPDDIDRINIDYDGCFGSCR